jgi:FkbM family methyltransferase
MRDLQSPPDLLDRVFAEIGSESTIRRREREMFAALSKGAAKAVIFGCGALGNIVWNGARSAGIEVVAFADNNPALQGGTHNGLPVMSPSDAFERFGDEAYFAVGVFNGSKPRKQLQEMGCDRVVPYAAFLWEYRPAIPDPLGLDRPREIVANEGAVREAYRCLSDERSRYEFAAQLAWRGSLDYSRLPAPDAPSEIYFPAELMRLSGREVLVDCGAFDGETIGYFRRKTPGAYERVFACEPDEKNQLALQTYIRTLPEDERRRVTILPFAVGSHDGIVHFEALGSVSSRVREGDGVAVECRRLDSLLADVSPTIVKMDIEGAEPDALVGAAETIRRARPILSVCAYHKNEHLWTLPVMIKAALPEYRIHLRRYAEECWETVYYAVPPERAVPTV